MAHERINSLDMLRGAAIVIMLLLSSPPDTIYPILEHAHWDGLTFPDTAFPMFAFAMGAGSAISMSRREPSTLKIFRRAISMFALGIFLNVAWDICELYFVGVFNFEIFFDGAIVHGRPFGIIQRLAVTYALAAFLARAIKSDVKIFLTAFVLLIVSSAGFHIYAPDNPFAEAHNISGFVDNIFPGANHIYTPTHDPEGLYGSIAGTASVLFGYVAGRVLIKNSSTREKIFLLTAAGIALLIAGGLWSFTDIISKKLWTAPFTLLNAGIDALLLALFVKFDDSKSARTFCRPLKALGVNPLFFFAANCLVLDVLIFTPSPEEGLGLYLWIYQHTTQGIVSTEFGATLFCVLWCLMWLPLAEILYRRKIIIKI